MDRSTLASALLSRIPLSKPPIGLAFVNAQPADVPGSVKTVQSSCAFWREA